MAEGPVITKPLRAFQDHRDNVLAVAVFPDGHRMVTGSKDKTLRLWDLKKGVVLKNMKGNQDSVWAVGISRDAQVIISGGGKGELIAWDGVTGESLIEAITAHSWSIFSLDFSPNSEVLATGSRDKTTKFWCTKTWKQQGNPIACDAVVYCVRYSPDGNLLAIATSRDIQICNPRTGDCIANFCSLADNMSLAWTPNGRQLLSAGSGSDSTIRGWDSLNWKQIDHPWSGHTSLINAIAINSAGTLVASASHDNHVRLWRLSDRRTIYVFKHSGAVCSVTFSADGKHILSGGYDKKVLEWKVPEDALSGDVPIELPLDVAIEPNPSSYLGYEEKRAALHRAKRYDEAIETFQNMLLKLEHSPDIQTRELRQQYVDRSEVEVAIRKIIDVQLENAPLRLLDTYSGYLCDQNAQISAFKASTEYKELVSSTTKRADLQGERIKHVVASYFQYVTLSHRWGKELRLQDIQEKNVYKMNRADGVVKLQSFCKASRDAGYRWAWSDTCCIDKSDGAEVSKSVNSMFTWYHHSALTIVYLSDVSKPGELEQSEWNERGWTFQELVAPKVVRFYQKDWTIYRNDLTPNHKHSDAIMEELREATGIDSRALVAFRPGTIDARERLQWASKRVTTVQEDVAYSLFGIFSIQLPVLYGEKKQNALGRLLQEIVARSGDITALDWVGQPSEFNSCVPAEITSYSYTALTCARPSLSEKQFQAAVSRLRNVVSEDLALKLYDTLDKSHAPRFSQCRLRLPCITFPVSEFRQKDDQGQTTYEAKAHGLYDLSIATEDKLPQFSPAEPIRQTFLLVYPWSRHLLELPDFTKPHDFRDNAQSGEGLWDDAQSEDSFQSAPEEYHTDSEPYLRALQLIVRLGQPFGAFLLAQQRGGEYKRIVSGHNIVAQVKDMASVKDMMDNIRTLEIL